MRGVVAIGAMSSASCVMWASDYRTAVRADLTMSGVHLGQLPRGRAFDRSGATSVMCRGAALAEPTTLEGADPRSGGVRWRWICWLMPAWDGVCQNGERPVALRARSDWNNARATAHCGGDWPWLRRRHAQRPEFRGASAVQCAERGTLCGRSGSVHNNVHVRCVALIGCAAGVRSASRKPGSGGRRAWPSDARIISAVIRARKPISRTESGPFAP